MRLNDEDIITCCRVRIMLYAMTHLCRRQTSASVCRWRCRVLRICRSEDDVVSAALLLWRVWMVAGVASGDGVGVMRCPGVPLASLACGSLSNRYPRLLRGLPPAGFCWRMCVDGAVCATLTCGSLRNRYPRLLRGLPPAGLCWCMCVGGAVCATHLPEKG